MWNRLKQFCSALTAEVRDEELRMVRTILTAEEYQLFLGMSIPNQRHVLNVAATAAVLAAGQEAGVNLPLLQRASLLHDVGRQSEDMSTADKVLAVLLDKVAPNWAKAWGQAGRGGRYNNIRHAIYVYYHHAERSAEALREIGAEEALIKIVRLHHEEPAAGDPVELAVLRRADALH